MDGPVVIRVLGQALMPPFERAMYIAEYDNDRYDGEGWARLTYDVDEALRFLDGGAAMEAWRSPSTVRPTRVGFDGRPNRPLTKYTCEFLSYEAAKAEDAR
jgi:hypothetical protein